MAKTKNILYEFDLEEVSGVNRPAQRPALATIMKSEDEDVDLSKLSDDELLEEEPLEDFTIEALQKGMANMATSVEGGHQHGISVHPNHDGSPHLYLSYAGDEQEQQHSHEIVRNADGSYSVTENFGHTHDIDEDELRNVVLSCVMKSDIIIPEGADIAGLLELWDQSGDTLLEKDGTMPDDNKIAAELEAAKTALAKAEAERDDAQSIAKMNDAEKRFMDKMEDDEAKKKFKAMGRKERMEMMRKADDENPVVYKSEITGDEFRKSDDQRLIDMAKRDDAREQEMADLRKAREDDAFTKMAENDFADIPGDLAVRKALARAIEKSDEEDEMKGKMKEAMRAKAAKMKGITKTLGREGISKADAEAGSLAKRDEASDEMDRLAKELQKSDASLSFDDAYEKAAEQNPEVYEAAISGGY